ncbi:MAG: GerAB/ArcD/ProY family transporter [Limnochordia bacterium]|jgi:spore germination protein|nr:endospore germination permease [Bacillota bacterium]
MENDRITSWQVIVLLISVINGTRLLDLPRILVQDAGPDGWLSLFFGHILAVGAAFVMIKLSQRFPRLTFVEYSRRIIGPFLGTIICLATVFLWTLISARIIRVFADVLKLFVFPRTPIEIIMLMMLLLSLYVVRNGLEPMARTLEILFPLILLTIGLVVLFAIPELDLTNLQPVLAKGLGPVIKGGLRQALEQRGIKLFLLVIPFMLAPQRVGTVVFLGLGINYLLQVIVFIVTIGVFGLHTEDFLWPVSMLAKFLAVPGGIVEHLEIIFMIIWVTAASASLMVNNYLACTALARLAGLRKQYPLAFPLAPIIFFLALLPNNVVVTEKILLLERMLGFVIAWITPGLLLLIAWMRGVKDA